MNVKRRWWLTPLVPVVAVCSMGATKCTSGTAETTSSYSSPVRYGGSHAAERDYAEQLVGAGEMGCLISLWNQESGWNPYAVNPTTGAYGIPQANPAAHGHPFALGDWRAQIRWGVAYISDRYGSACAAEDHEQSDNWY